MPQEERQVEWSIDDGYCNSATHILRVRSSDFDEADEVDDIVRGIELMLEDAFASKVQQSWSDNDVREVAEAIHAELHS